MRGQRATCSVIKCIFNAKLSGRVGTLPINK